jgi:ABC-type transport system substrate-binding protein
MPNTAAVAGGRVWVALTPSAADARRGLDSARTVRMVTQGDPWGTSDPPLAFSGPGAQLQRAIGARLLGIPAGPQGRAGGLAPELADLPTVSADGRTYTFRMRRGFGFSPPSNAPVTADVMRFTIERALSPAFKDFVEPHLMLADLVGFDAYRRGQAAHVAGIQVRGDRLVFRLRRPAPDFPTRVSLPAFSAVPPGTPVLAHGLPLPIPSAGRFYLASHIGGAQEVLRRNPNHPAAGKGDVDAIVVTNTVDPEQAVRDVVAGRADVAAAPPAAQSGGLSAAWLPGGDLDRRFGPQAARRDGPRMLRTRFPAIRFLLFNTRKGLFRDPVLRRAAVLALDPRSLSVPSGELPWRSPIGPGMPGAPDPDAPVAGPDLERARALARGRGGEALLFVNTPDRCAGCAAAGQRVRRQLAEIGIRVRVKADPSTPNGWTFPDTPADLVLAGWVYDWPDPSNVLNGMVDAGRPLGYGYGSEVADRLYDDAAGVAAVRAANRATGPARDGAYRRAAAVLERHPPFAVTGVNNQPTLVGPRVGCVSFPPQDLGYLDLAAVCLR